MNLKVICDNIRNFMIAAAVFVVGLKFIEARQSNQTIFVGMVLCLLGGWLAFVNAFQTAGIFWRLNTEDDPDPVRGRVNPDDVFEKLSTISKLQIAIGVIVAVTMPVSMIMFMAGQVAKW